jgi:flavin-binding protein dodecin
MTVYKIINIVGESNSGFSDAVKNAIDKATKTVNKIKYAEIERFTAKIENDAISSYRAEVKLSFEVEN